MITFALSSQVIIFLVCMVGCGIHCWHLGNMQGIEACIDNLIEQGYLVVEEEDEDS
jgi:hypothetical protein